MPDTTDLISSLNRQILENCDISDAKYAGYYSICGLALRLRDLYKWEHHLSPWVEKESAQVLDWIDQKETLWEQISQKDFSDLCISGICYDYLDTQNINAILSAYGLFYGAGYAYRLKPTFLLARIKEVKTIFDTPILILGQEMARDLLTLPAFTQDGQIVIRFEALRLYLWDQMFYLKKSGLPALQYALGFFGVEKICSQKIKTQFDTIMHAHIDLLIYHELGEIHTHRFDRQTFQDMVATFAHTPIELFARAVKDLLADTNEFGTLQFIIKHRRKELVGFYVAFLDGLLKVIFPQIIEAFVDFRKSEDWQPIEDAMAQGYDRALAYCQKLIDIFEQKDRKSKKWVADRITKEMLAPLGITTESLT